MAIIFYAPLIGLVLLLIISFVLKIKSVTSKNFSIKKYSGLYKVLAIFEVILIANSIICPFAFDSVPVPKGMSVGSRILITPDKFRVSYTKANRGYSNRISLNDDELDNVCVICSADNGKVELVINQDDKKEIMDITNTEQKIDMSNFEAGDISFSLINDNAHNVKFELMW